MFNNNYSNKKTLFLLFHVKKRDVIFVYRPTSLPKSSNPDSSQGLMLTLNFLSKCVMLLHVFMLKFMLHLDCMIIHKWKLAV